MFYYSLWHHEGGERGSLSFYPTAAAYQNELAAVRQKKQRPARLNGYATPDGCGFAVVWETDDGTPQKVRHDLTADDYQFFLQEGRAEGYRPISVSGYSNSGALRFTAVLLKDKPNLEWQARQGLTSAQFREENERWLERGYYPLILSGYWQENTSRYLAVWIKDQPLALPPGSR
jgi:hypothetical protein